MASLSHHLLFDLTLQRNDIDLPFPTHAFVTNLVTSRIGSAFSTRANHPTVQSDAQRRWKPSR